MRGNVTIRMQFLQQTSQVYHIVVILTIKNTKKQYLSKLCPHFYGTPSNVFCTKKQCISAQKQTHKNQQLSAHKPTYFCTETNVFLHKNRVSAQKPAYFCIKYNQHISAQKATYFCTKNNVFLHKKHCNSAHKIISI